MELSNNHSHITIKGIVKGFADVQALKNYIESVSANNTSLVLEFIDAYALPSSIVGYLNKKIHSDGINITLIVHQKELYELIDMLALLEIFHVKSAF